jgi:hypothetical protein
VLQRISTAVLPGKDSLGRHPANSSTVAFRMFRTSPFLVAVHGSNFSPLVTQAFDSSRRCILLRTSNRWSSVFVGGAGSGRFGTLSSATPTLEGQ